MNSYDGVGRLTRDPELRQAGDTEVCDMRVAFPGRNRERPPCYVNVAAFGAQARACTKNLRKGSQIGLEAELRHREWDSDNGRRQEVSLTANWVDFLSPRPDDVDSEEPQSEAEHQEAEQEEAVPAAA